MGIGGHKLQQVPILHYRKGFLSYIKLRFLNIRIVTFKKFHSISLLGYPIKARNAVFSWFATVPKCNLSVTPRLLIGMKWKFSTWRLITLEYGMKVPVLLKNQPKIRAVCTFFVITSSTISSWFFAPELTFPWYLLTILQKYLQKISCNYSPTKFDFPHLNFQDYPSYTIIGQMFWQFFLKNDPSFCIIVRFWYNN